MPAEVGNIAVGDILEGVVTGITHFGAFVQLSNGKTGLVHISEIADVFVKDIREFVKERDNVRVKVLSMGPDGKIALSIKQAQPSRRRDPSFEDKLARFLKESDERLQDLRRNTDSKRGGRGTGRSRNESYI
jgi:S1 RNA binding domain protein